MATIHPLHTATPHHNMPFDHLARKADKIFSICGPYWTDTIAQTPFSHWGPKIVRLDMAVDKRHYPYLRTKFNPPGQRKLVYIGANMPMKNVDYLYQIMRRMSDVRLHWYGGDGGHPLARLPNVDVTGWVTLTPDMAKKIVNECDIFVNVSNSDANPTTLLEAMAWGIITSCTKESGYWKDPLFTELHLNDLGATVKALRDLLELPNDALMQRAAKGRVAIETKYNWERFCQTVWNELEPHVTA
jgi:glycosyltransferase involved in cell wall biosynthesis